MDELVDVAALVAGKLCRLIDFDQLVDGGLSSVVLSLLGNDVR